MDTTQKNIDIIFKLIDQTKAGAKSIVNNLNAIKTSVTTVDKKVKSFGTQFKDSMQESKYSVQQLGVAFTGLGALIVAPFALATRESATFEASMSAVKAISGATIVEFEKLEAVALTMGRETRFSATESADALKFMSMAGLDASESIKSLPSVLQLATAGNLDLAQSADIATNIMTAYGFAADDLGMVNDRLVTAFTNSNSNLIELGEAFKYVGPIAKGVGADFDDLISSLGLLHDAGIKGSMAGTTLRQTLDALLNPTRQEADLLEDLSKRIGGTGLQIEDSAGKFVGFESLIGQLEKSGIKAGEALKLFGARAGPGMVSLLQQGSGELNEFNNLMADSDGTAAQIAKTMDKNFSGAMKRAWSAISGLAISIGNNFIPAIAGLADGFASFLNTLTEVHEFLGPFATVIEVLVLSFGLMAVAVGVASIAYVTIIGPVGAAVKAVLALTYANGIAVFSLRGVSQALVVAAVKAKTFIASLGFVGLALTAISIAIVAAIGYLTDFNKNTLEVAESHKEQARSIGLAITAYERYEKKIKGLLEFSPRMLKANKVLKASYKAMFSEEGHSKKFLDSLEAAYYSIDATTGVVKDSGIAIKAFNVSNTEQQLSHLSEELYSIGENMLDVSNESTFFSLKMNKSWREIKKEVGSYSENIEELTERQSETQAAFQQSTSKARKFLEELQKVGAVDLSGSFEDTSSLQNILDTFRDTGENAEIMVNVIKDSYEDLRYATRTSSKDISFEQEKGRTENLQQTINSYKGVIAEVKNRAKDVILADQEKTAALLSNDKLSAENRENLSVTSALKISEIEKNKFIMLEELAAEYYEAVKELDPNDTAAIAKAAQSAVKASNVRRDATIKDINFISAAKRAVTAEDLAEAEQNFTKQRRWAEAETSNAISILQAEYAQKRVDTVTYWEDRQKIIETAQKEEIKGLEELKAKQTDINSKDVISTEIAELKISHAITLRDLAVETSNAKTAEAEAEKAAMRDVNNLKLSLAAEDPADTTLGRLEAKYQLEEEMLLASQAAQLQMHEDAGASKDALDAIRQQQVRQRLAEDQEHQQAYYDAIAVMSGVTSGQVYDTFAALYEATGKKHKELFYVMKAASIAQAMISTYTGAAGALAEPGGYLGMALSALIMVQGMSNVAQISAQSMADGGWVQGNSPNDRSDNIPVNLTAKEYVMPVAVGRKYGDRVMNAMRTGMLSKDVLTGALGDAGRYVPRAIPSYHLAGGGPVPTVGGSSAGAQSVNIVNVVDPQLFEKYTNSEEGQQSIINVISDKAFEINQVLKSS